MVRADALPVGTRLNIPTMGIGRHHATIIGAGIAFDITKTNGLAKPRFVEGWYFLRKPGVRIEAPPPDVDAEAVQARAFYLARLPPRQYAALGYNCEHVANFVVTGKATSTQADVGKGALLLAFAAGLAAAARGNGRPAKLRMRR